MPMLAHDITEYAHQAQFRHVYRGEECIMAFKFRGERFMGIRLEESGIGLIDLDGDPIAFLTDDEFRLEANLPSPTSEGLAERDYAMVPAPVPIGASV